MVFVTIQREKSELFAEQLLRAKAEANDVIKQKAGQVPSHVEKERFIQSVEAELRGLHEGNIARYRLRPSEYEALGRPIGPD